MTERDDTSGYEARVLGPLAVVGPDGPVDPGGPKPRLLLALLVAEAGRVVSNEWLIDGLWFDAHGAPGRRGRGPTRAAAP